MVFIRTHAENLIFSKNKCLKELGWLHELKWNLVISLQDDLLVPCFLLSSFPSLETLVNVLLLFPSLLKLKPPSHLILSHGKIYRKYSCQPFHCTFYATESDVLLTHDEFKPSVCHQWSVCSYFPESMTDCCERKDSSPKIQSNAFVLSMFSWRNNRKFLAWFNPTLPTHNVPE